MGHIRENEKKIITRIRKIKGQLDAVEKGISSGKDCSSILQTLSACRGAMNGLMGELIEDHIKEHIMQDSNHPVTEQDKSSVELVKILKSYWK